MAMLRVSSYRKLFEDDSWRRNGGLSVRCAGQYRASVRSVWVLLTTFKVYKHVHQFVCEGYGILT